MSLPTDSRDGSAELPVRLGTVDVSRLDFDATMEQMATWLEEEGHRRIATANLDFLRMASRDEDLRSSLLSADLVTADGMPLLWLSRLAGEPIAGRVTGSDLTPALLDLAAERGYRVYFFGGGEGRAAAAARQAMATRPGLLVVGAEGPSVDLDDAAAMRVIEERIEATKCDLLFVGLGCPKQELFLERHLARTGARIGIGIGGTFDFLSGCRRRAPAWVGACGMEWLWRVAREPGRLGLRYAANALVLPGLAWRSLLQSF